MNHKKQIITESVVLVDAQAPIIISASRSTDTHRTKSVLSIEDALIFKATQTK